MTQHPLHGIMAEFKNAPALIHATKEAHKAGYRQMDAYSPYPLEGCFHAMGARHSRLPWLIFLGGLIGGLSGFGFQYWVSTMAYPLNVGGRPLNTWPMFIPVTFELTILFSRIDGGDRHAGPVRLSHAVSPRVQRGPLRQGQQ